MNKAELRKRIEAQEKKDRFVASKCLAQILSAHTDLQLTATSITSWVDLYGEVTSAKTGRRKQFTVEIKERFKDADQLKKYPTAELKVEKAERMQKSQKGALLYMVLLNEKECLLFDLTNQDWDNTKQVIWNIKKTQLDPNSEKVPTPVYLIPYDKAIVKIDCSKYF